MKLKHKREIAQRFIAGEQIIVFKYENQHARKYYDDVCLEVEQVLRDYMTGKFKLKAGGK